MTLSNVLVATDFSDDSERALATALELVARDGRVTLLHVCQVPPGAAPDLGLYVPSPALLDDIIGDARRQLGTLQARWSGRGPTVDAAWVVGTPAEEIVRFAEDRGYDLVVIGSHGRRGFRRLVLGSVAEKVVRSATVPVLTVHARHRLADGRRGLSAAAKAR